MQTDGTAPVTHRSQTRRLLAKAAPRVISTEEEGRADTAKTVAAQAASSVGGILRAMAAWAIVGVGPILLFIIAQKIYFKITSPAPSGSCIEQSSPIEGLYQASVESTKQNNQS